jgi:uncharacterized lipoprotein YmbA
MKHMLHLSWVIAILMLVLPGCASSPATRFYVLSAMPDVRDIPGSKDVNCITLGVGPIELPAYLNRLQMVTTASDNELVLADFDRWAQPLSSNFSHVLAENISKLTCTKTVHLFPWSGPELVDYRISGEVMTLKGSLGGNASMEVWWKITGGKEMGTLVSERSQYTEPVQGHDYQALVQAYSRMLLAFSKDIVRTIPKP